MNESLSSLPTMALSPCAASETVLPKQPTVSKCLLIGITPVLDVSPTVGLIPTTPLIEAGPMMEVSVSVPNDKGTIFADTATAEPELDPTSTRILALTSADSK